MEPSDLDVDGDSSCMQVVDSEGFVFCGLLIPAGCGLSWMCQSSDIGFGLGDSSCACYLPLGLVCAGDCNAF